jgi:hypothetical protein
MQKGVWANAHTPFCFRLECVTKRRLHRKKWSEGRGARDARCRMYDVGGLIKG